MERVQGIGGVFFRSKDPKALAQWYETHLGINPAPTDMHTPPWQAKGGVTVFAPFGDDSDYLPADKSFMLNFRVASLERMLVQLRAAGITVEREETMEGLGQFARIHDPDGNPVELWQPAWAED